MSLFGSVARGDADVDSDVDLAAKFDPAAGIDLVRLVALGDAVRDAAERCIERVCEAARRLGEHANALIPGQPWRDIQGMGNRLRHAYDRIDVDITWSTGQVRLPELATGARQALAELASEKGDTG